MSGNYRSVFDIIGPIMIGPSSSHTAGAVAIGQAMPNKLFGGVPNKVTVHYYGSFAQTHRGHGTDYAIAAGVLGFAADDSRVPSAPEIARDGGMDLRYVEEGDSPIDHPNTAIIDMSDGDKKVQISGCSISGGSIEIRQFILHGVTVEPSGPLPIVIFVDLEKKRENAFELTAELEKKAPFSRKQVLRGDDCDIYEYDIKNYMQEDTIKELKSKFDNIICL